VRTKRATLSVLSIALVALALAPSAFAGSVEEQRQRLPPPADCEDPVEGTWLGIEWLPYRGQWYENTLNIRRASKDSTDLVGDMYVHYWYGTAADSHPPPCRPGGMEESVKQPGATGKLEGNNVSFGATTYTHDKTGCGTWSGRYWPDHFSGTIDTTIEEFQSVNNDGHAAVNDPVVFRRIKCFDGLPPANGSGTPPPYAPPKHGFTCGR
jgi:hypothetical protein